MRRCVSTFDGGDRFALRQTKHCLELVLVQPLCIIIAAVSEIIGARVTTHSGRGSPLMKLRKNDKVFVIFPGVPCVVLCNHYLMKLLAGTDADNFRLAFRRNGPCQIHDVHAWNLRHKDLSSSHAVKRIQHEQHRLLQSDPESRHARVGYREYPCLAQFKEQRNDASTAT